MIIIIIIIIVVVVVDYVIVQRAWIYISDLITAIFLFVTIFVF